MKLSPYHDPGQDRHRCIVRNYARFMIGTDPRSNPSCAGTVSPMNKYRRRLAGGVPLGRWNEGLLFEGISPQPWLKSAANWFPNTEEIQPNEMRIIFMGTSPKYPPGTDEHINTRSAGKW